MSKFLPNSCFKELIGPLFNRGEVSDINEYYKIFLKLSNSNESSPNCNELKSNHQNYYHMREKNNGHYIEITSSFADFDADLARNCGRHHWNKACKIWYNLMKIWYRFIEE